MIRDDLPERFHQRWETILAHVGSRATSSPAVRSPQPRTRAPAIPLEMGPEEPGGDMLLSDYAQAVMKENIDLDDDAPS